MSDADLASKLSSLDTTTKYKKGSIYYYQRKAIVTENAKRKANGRCQLCNNPAPFNNKKGKPYLESHHVKWLSDNGLDSPNNTSALCPNCHRKMHILNLVEDQEILFSKIR